MINLPIVSNKFNVVTSVTGFNTVDANRIPIGRIARLTTIKIVHWKRGVRRYLVQTLSVRYCFFHGILIIKYLQKKLFSQLNAQLFK